MQPTLAAFAVRLLDGLPKQQQCTWEIVAAPPAHVAVTRPAGAPLFLPVLHAVGAAFSADSQLQGLWQGERQNETKQIC